MKLNKNSGTAGVPELIASRILRLTSFPYSVFLLIQLFQLMLLDIKGSSYATTPKHSIRSFKPSQFGCNLTVPTKLQPNCEDFKATYTTKLQPNCEGLKLPILPFGVVA